MLRLLECLGGHLQLVADTNVQSLEERRAGWSKQCMCVCQFVVGSHQHIYMVEAIK